jgi:O-acetyl-ADP-ribose deacetylase (regulator of RNase III)
MHITLCTSDFDIYFFDSKNTFVENVAQIRVETLFKRYQHTTEKVAFISSANSLGFMDGGSDLGYMNAINGIQGLVQTGIKKLNYRTQLGRPFLDIGDTMAFQLPQNPNILFVSAPTMFLPQNVYGTQNQYTALKSALQLCKHHRVSKVFVPMMCTNWGGYDFKTSFELMKQAVLDYSTTHDSHIVHIDEYSYNVSNEEDKKKILKNQPKTYMNTEFGVTIEEVLEATRGSLV